MKSVNLREADGKDTEVPLKTRVDGEGTSSWVHGGNVLHILHIFEGLFLAIIPVFVVQMLTEKERGKSCVNYILIHSKVPSIWVFVLPGG